MSNLTNFKNFITESSDRTELNTMGFKSDLSFDDRLNAAIHELYNDPEINDAIKVLTTRAEGIMLNNDIDIKSDSEDEFKWHKRLRKAYTNPIDPILNLLYRYL